MSTVLITGGTGLIGKHLCSELRQRGFQVVLLSRSINLNVEVKTYAWDLEKSEIDREAIEIADYIIHLAGANIGDKRWTTKQKKLIIDSRVKTTQSIFYAIKENKNKIKAFISASAVGYYGTSTSDKIFEESDVAGNDFLAKTCSQWEQAVDRFEEIGIRTVKLRTGIVLTKQSGALSKMAQPVKMGIGSALGNGRQYLPWIHIDDLCSIYIKAIEDSRMNGAYNAVAPDHKTDAEFTRTLARVLKKPFWLPNVPAILLKIIFGEMSVLLLNGNRVSDAKIIASGYKFKFPFLESALSDLFGKT
jgi:uncharacterized protein